MQASASQLRRRLLVGALIVIGLGGLMVGGIVLLPTGILNRVTEGPPNDTTRLRDRSIEFNAALRAGRIDRIYQLFNAGFREEISLPQLTDGIRTWLRGRVINRVWTSHIEIRSLGGMVNSYVYFQGAEAGGDRRAPGRPFVSGSEPPTVPEETAGGKRQRFAEDFLSQYWIRGNKGWELVWLNRLDDVALDYGRSDSATVGELLQLALSEFVTQQGIQKRFDAITVTDRIILLWRDGSEYPITLPGKEVVWLSEPEIAARIAPRAGGPGKAAVRSTGNRLGATFCIDAQRPRVLRDLAIVTLDVVPLPQGSSPPQRARSIRLFFARKDGRWNFVDYGMRL